MNIHEYQAKDVFAGYGIPILAGKVATTPDEAADIAAEIGGQVVVKAQVHTGGRGKAGGVKLAADPDEAREKAAAILALSIKGYPVRKVLVVPASDIAKEYYLGVTMDRAAKKPVIIASAAGGVDIVCVETMTDLEEARQAVLASKKVAPDIPVMATMTFDKTRRGFYTMMGVSIAQACDGLLQAGADLIGSNCGNGLDNMIEIAREFRRNTSLPLIIQSNAGLPFMVSLLCPSSAPPASKSASARITRAPARPAAKAAARPAGPAPTTSTSQWA